MGRKKPISKTLAVLLNMVRASVHKLNKYGAVQRRGLPTRITPKVCQQQLQEVP